MVSIDRRERGGSPTRAATMLVVPIDNPNGSLITDLTIAAITAGMTQTLRRKRNEQRSPS
jgi:hypothetical protein